MPGGRNWRRWEPGDDRRVRRAGVVALVLLLGSIILALFLAYRYRLGVAQTSESLLIGGGTLAGIYLAWVAYRDSQASDKTLTLVAIADELASAIGGQWEREANVRRLNDPYPLPVRWVPADSPLSEEWEALVTLASSGPGWPIPAGTWAADPSELAGDGNGLVDVLDQVPTGRLVVLGKPGSGKTILMVRLILDLLQRRSNGGVVPVLLSVASWNPAIQDFHAWLTSQLLATHPALDTPYPARNGSMSRIEALLEQRLVMPILDGFDELPEGVRSRAIAEINGQLRPGERLIITSRTAEYRAATRPAAGLETTLSAAAVELCPLSRKDITIYLRQSAGGPRSASRWDPVFAELSRSKSLTRVLSNPLMIGLARVIYNPRPDEQIGSLPDPVELRTFRSKRSIERHLLDAFIPAAFRPGGERGPIRREWNAQSAERWLSFLANHLECVIHEPELSWWDLNVASPVLTYIISGLAAGLTVGAPIILIPLLLVVTSVIRVRIAASPGYDPGLFSLLGIVFQQYWERIAEIILLFGAAGGVAGLAVALGPHSSNQNESISTPWNGRYSVAAKLFLSLLYGTTYAVLIYAILQPSPGWREYLMILCVLAVGLYAGRTCVDENFRAATVAMVTIGAIVGAPFFLYKNFSSTDYSPIGLPIILAIGLPAGFAAGLAVAVRGKNEKYPSRSIRWSPRKGFASGLVAWAGATIISEFTVHRVLLALTFGIIVGLGAITVIGLERVPGDLRIAASPTLVLKRDRSATLVLCMITAVAAGLIVGIGTFAVSIDGLLSDISPVSDAVIFGLTIGPAVGFTFGFTLRGYGSVWSQWIFTRQILAIRHKTPHRLMTFLEDSHARGVLRQVGPVYQFRHIELQRRLANNVVGKNSPTWLQRVAVSETMQERQSTTRPRPFAPLSGKPSRRRRFALQIVGTMAVLIIATLAVTVLDPGALTRTDATSQLSSSLVPVVSCPASYGDGGIRPMHSPAVESAPVPHDLSQMFTYYTDTAHFIFPILGPRGWECSASVGADGGWSMTIYPQGESGNKEGIQAGGPSCIGCTYFAVCPIIPHVSAEMNYEGGKCQSDHIAKQVVSWVIGSPNFSTSGNDVVSIVDPPGVKGYLTYSGGLYSARGILLYFWGQPATYLGSPSSEGISGASTISCALPNSDASICKIILASFRRPIR